MTFEVNVDHETAECLSIHVSGDINVRTSPVLREVMNQCFSEQVESVQVDLKEVPSMDSSGIATLVEGLKWSKGSDRHFTVSGLSSPVRDLFVLSKLDREFEIVEASESV